MVRFPPPNSELVGVFEVFLRSIYKRICTLFFLVSKVIYGGVVRHRKSSGRPSYVRDVGIKLQVFGRVDWIRGDRLLSRILYLFGKDIVEELFM